MGRIQRRPISAAVEGLLDEVVLRRLLRQIGVEPDVVYGRQGKERIRQRLPGYNAAARHSRWIVLTDLDRDAPCAPSLRKAWLPKPERFMCFNVAVHEVEAWLLADRDRIATFLQVPVGRVPRNPELERDPKALVVRLAKRSSSGAIIRAMTPDPRSGRRVGPEYTSRLMEFVRRTENGWRPTVAARSSASLQRCLRSLRDLAT